MSVPFTRLKKKSLLLAFRIIPEELEYLLEDLRNKKLVQCLISESLKDIDNQNLNKRLNENEKRQITN